MAAPRAAWNPRHVVEETRAGETESVGTSVTGADDVVRARVQRRTLVVVMVSQVLGGLGLAAGITVGALLAQDMLGSDRLAGVPTVLFTVGAAVAAFLVGRVAQRWGRRIGLGLGFVVGGVGGLGVVAAAVLDNLPLLFVALFVYGAGSATNLQARYAGTDLALPEQRGRAISVAMVATTLGALVGPNLTEPLGGLAESLGIPALAGPFLLSVAFVAAGIVLLVLLRPDPFLLARRLAGEAGSSSSSDPLSLTKGVQNEGNRGARTPRARLSTGVYVGATVMVLTQVAMVAIMTMTPVHMLEHHHGLGDVGLVISLHVAAMFLPSLVTGSLVDRVGSTWMAVAAGTTLLLAGVVGAAAPGDSLVLLVLALVLLGLGWNFGLISGTALVVSCTAVEERPRVQGSIDVLISLAGAGAGALSGVVVAGTSYATLALGGGILALALVPVLLWARGRA